MSRCMENILKNIEAIRKAKHIKQEELAAELGIKQSSYSSYITRESDITYSRLLDSSGWPLRRFAAQYKPINLLGLFSFPPR